ncbi:MAG: hypothetical protein GY829_12955 [Gammaproteobacteria bacterium]|nr:hypothetical protein [Gammaproteobacteria bacterium]
MPLNIKAEAFEFKILKWLLISVIIFGLYKMFFEVGVERTNCKEACYEKSFFDFRYTPKKRRRAEKSACYCLTEAEAKQTDKTPKGVQMF